MSDVVKVKHWVEIHTTAYFVESELEFTREEWDSMSVEEREAEINNAAAEFMTNYATYGYEVEPNEPA